MTQAIKYAETLALQDCSSFQQVQTLCKEVQSNWKCPKSRAKRHSEREPPLIKELRQKLRTLPINAFAARLQVERDIVKAQKCYLTNVRLVTQKAKLASGAGLVKRKALTDIKSMRVEILGHVVTTNDVSLWSNSCQAFYRRKFRCDDDESIIAQRHLSRRLGCCAGSCLTADQYEIGASRLSKETKCDNEGVALLAVIILQRAQKHVFAAVMNGLITDGAFSVFSVALLS